MKKYVALLFAGTLLATGCVQAKKYSLEQRSKKVVRIKDQAHLDKLLEKNDVVLYAVHGLKWCGTCQASWNGLNKFADSYVSKKMKRAVVDTDVPAGFSGPEAQLASAYQVHGVPTFILFHKGKEVARKSGLMAKASDYVVWVNQNVK